ncbi:MAG: carbamoyl-phosphate synthase subunit L [Armatimonadetes bacterium CSP1-3]|jgi:biotin carboxyl carrier protein|nr:MAG: carbamoyl-phosphate synthase subunit L [Armatimonadetes bacterium CSP1-3]
MKYAVTGAGPDLEVEVLDPPAGPGRLRVRVHGREYDVGWSPALGSTHWWLEWDGRRQMVAIEPEGDGLGVTLAIDHLDLRVAPASPLPRKRREQGGTLQTVEVRAPMPGLLVTVEVRPGQAVGAGATVAVIEAMKMQMELRAPAAGTVREVRATGGREVSAGEVIAVLVPDGGGR